MAKATTCTCRELPAESVRLLLGELLEGGLRLRPTSPTSSHGQLLLEEVFVVAVRSRRIRRWRTAGSI
jgi:hypothetical protein